MSASSYTELRHVYLFSWQQCNKFVISHYTNLHLPLWRLAAGWKVGVRFPAGALSFSFSPVVFIFFGDYSASCLVSAAIIFRGNKTAGILRRSQLFHGIPLSLSVMSLCLMIKHREMFIPPVGVPFDW
jgi:hypothetical protein